ncbi:MAG: hypothetical protein AB4426_29660 [Xenococcaceae cyanobacterium]
MIFNQLKNNVSKLLQKGIRFIGSNIGFIGALPREQDSGIL